MRRKRRRLRQLLTAVVFLCGVLVGLTVQTPTRTAAASTFVYPASDMVGQGGYIYFIRTAADGRKARICRKHVASGTVSTLVRETSGIERLVVNGSYLYYTATDEKARAVVRMCRLDGTDARTVCEGSLCVADGTQVYAIKTLEDGRQRLFGIALDETAGTFGKKYAIKTTAANETLAYTGMAGTVHYYELYQTEAQKLILYRLDAATGKLARAAVEKRVLLDAVSPLTVSAIAQVGEELYYDFGSYEGTGNYWYGTVKKLSADGKKKTIVKHTGSDELLLGTRELYFSSLDGDSYKCQLSSGKKTKYVLPMQRGVSYTILGDKTYLADMSNTKKITISRFQSGTERETLTNNFISLSFKQKKNVSYTVHIEQVGIYNLVCVTGTDYTDASYGWRGKLTSIDWYLTDGAGTVLGSFK